MARSKYLKPDDAGQADDGSKGLLGRRANLAGVIYELGEYTLPASPFGQVAMTLDVGHGGRLICTKVTISATYDHPEVSASDLRNLPFSAYRDQVFAAAGWRPHVEAVAPGTFRITGGAAAPDATKVANKRRNRVNPQSLADVADIVRRYPKTDERADATASAEAYRVICDRFNCTPRSAQLWVKRAKDAGLL